MSDALVPWLVGLSGIVLGFVLSTGWAWWRSSRNEKVERDSLRQLVAQKIDLNYRRLLGFVATMMPVKQQRGFSGIAS
jgi:hypothetical protein